MTVHNYRSRQVHETLNGVNPSSGFRDMRSAKSGSNLWQIWQVFGPWASPYGANGQMSMTVHNYRPRQFHRTSNRENPSSGYRDMGSASLAAARPTARPPARQSARPPARPPGPWRQYPSSPEGWGVKRERGCILPTGGLTHRLLKYTWAILKSYFLKSFNVSDNLSNSSEIAIRGMPHNPTNDNLTLVQVMAWCRQATSHYLSSCWPICMSSYGITRPQCVDQIGRKTDIDNQMPGNLNNGTP